MKTKETTWMLEKKQKYPSLSGSVETDVVVVGGGMAGILTAAELTEAGKNVILIDKGEIGSGTTAYTTAFLTQSLDTEFKDLEKSFGLESAKIIEKSHRDAINRFRELIKKYSIECDYQTCSNYIYANKEKDAENFASQTEDGKRLGVDTEYNTDSSLLGIPNYGFIEVKDQGKFHPLKFLYSLADKMTQKGLVIYENTEAVEIHKRKDGIKIVTKNGEIDAGWGIVTTYNPFDNPLSLYFRKGTYLSYVLELEVKDMELKEAIYEDVENPYHYFRVDKVEDGYRVVIGGEDHRKDIPVDETRNFNALIEYCNTIFPKEKYGIHRKWVGMILEPIDGIPSIGRIDDTRTLYTLGFSGNGMTYSMISALLFRDIILKKKNSWEDIYYPRRRPTLSSLFIKGRDYGEELINGALKNFFTENKDILKDKED